MEYKALVEMTGQTPAPHVNDVVEGGGLWVGGLDSNALAKGKSAVMNNVCKNEERVKGGEESQ